MSQRSIDAELRGRTLEVYIYLLRRNEPVGVREVQRQLRFSSPSVAFHHLEKLKSLGVVEKDESGQYRAVGKVDAAVLHAFTKVGSLILPRMLFYAVFFTTFTLLYIITNITAPNPYAIVLGLSASAACWFETIRTWVKKPW